MWWARKYASFPTAERISADVVRVYFTGLDEHQRGRGGYVDLSAWDLTKILSVSSDPVLDIGEIGDFDDSGANPFSVIAYRGRKMMYYQGWQRLARSPYAVFTGLAISDANSAKFQKAAHTPILERTEEERHMRAAPFVMAESARLQMWYVASSQWRYRDSQLYYNISISHGVSEDGVTWKTLPCIGLETDPEREYAVGRPTVLRDGDLYRMWYSIRAFDRPYAIGYAESQDGVVWERKDDKAGLTRSESGWDSEMICYPFVIRIGDRTVMFYNGNHHGESGFGCAEAY
jgi:hypothetical protein